MANKDLFKSSLTGKLSPPADTINEAGGKAYSLTTEAALAQLAATGMLGDTMYTAAADQLNTVVSLASKVSGDFLGKLAVYSRESGKLKDMPALLVAILFANGEERVVKQVFLRVINNGRMLRNFVQIVRSGAVGRKSLGTLGKKLVASYFESKSPEQLFKDTVGNSPSLADVIKLAHVRPTNATRQALYRYIISKELDLEQVDALPELVKDFELFKAARTKNETKKLKVPEVPFEMLTALPLTTDDWKQIAKNGNWHFVRMNLNTFERHGVLKDNEMVSVIAEKLRDPAAIRKARVMPYQLLMAYLNTEGVNANLRNALQDAMDTALENVPSFGSDVAVSMDISGSMGDLVTGDFNSKAKFIDVAALFTSAILRKNPTADVSVFNTTAKKVSLNSRDSVMTNAEKLRNMLSGGTAISSSLRDMNTRGVKANLVVLVSDNQSWFDNNTGSSFYGGSRDETVAQQEWSKFKARNKGAKLVAVNIAPYTTAQVAADRDVLNIGGFTDAIFETVANFAANRKSNGDEFVNAVKAIEL